MRTFLIVLTAFFIVAATGRSFVSGFIVALACIEVWREVLDSWDR